MRKIYFAFAIALILLGSEALLFTQNATAVDPAIIRLVPSVSELNNSMIGQTITVNLTIQNVQKLWSWTAAITWDPTVLNCTKIQEGSFLSDVGTTLFPPPVTETGKIREATSTMLSTDTANGNGTLLIITYKVLSVKTTELSLNVSRLREPSDPQSQTEYFPPITHTDYGTSLTAATVSPTPTTTIEPTPIPTETPETSPSNPPTETISPSISPSPSASLTPSTSLIPTDSTGSVSRDVLIIVGAGAVIAVVVGLGAFIQRRKS
jgi:hypothetical protein